MRLRYLFCILISLGFAEHSRGYQPLISTPTLAKYIDPPSITAIHRDARGQLWIGTQEGLYKYDGDRLTLFDSAERNSNFIPASDIRAIGENRDGAILIASYGGGLLRWSKELSKFQEIATGGNRDPFLTSLYVSENNGIWVGTQNRLLHYDYNLKAIALDPRNELSRSGGKHYSFADDLEGNTYIAGNSGLNRIAANGRIDSLNKALQTTLKDTSTITALLFSDNGHLIAGTDTGKMLLLDPETGISRSISIDNEAENIVTSIELFQSHLLIATDQGLFISDTQLSTTREISEEGVGLSSTDIFTLHADKSQVWIGTYNGLDTLRFSPFELYNSSNSGIHNDVLAFAEDHLGNIWIGSYNGLFFEGKKSESHIEFGRLGALTLDRRITAMTSFQDQIWIGFFRSGIQAIDIAALTSHLPELVHQSDFSVSDLVINQKTGSLWIATDGHGLINIEAKQIKNFFTSGFLIERRISTLLFTRDAHLFAATPNGLYQYLPNRNTFTRIEIAYELSEKNPMIYSLAEDKSGTIWIGSKDEGLFFWKRDRQDTATYNAVNAYRASDLRHSTIYGIQIDNDDNIWCSTQNGIVKLDPNGKLIKRFTKADGLQGNDFNLGASFKDRRGRIYFGGANGYNRFDPSTVPTATEPSPMMLTGVTVPGGRINNIHLPSGIPTLELSHRDDSISFHFSVLDFTAPEKNEYRYKLVNFDNQWINNRARNTATYTDLPSGDYTFLVQGANSSGTWNTEGISVNVRKRTTPWLSWWAFYIYGLLGAITVWACFRIYKSYAIERHSLELATQLYETESEADDDFHEFIEIQSALATAARAHSKSTLDIIEYCITSQRDEQTSTLERKLADGSVKRINVLSRLKQYTRYEPESVQINLHSFVDATVSDLLQITEVRPESIITINDIEDDYLSSAVATPLGIILFELLENIFLHAFTAASPANYIHLQLNIEESCQRHGRSVHLSVQDSGRGFPQDMLKACEAMSGLAIVQAIIRRLGGNIKFGTDSSAHISIIIPAIPDHR